MAVLIEAAETVRVSEFQSESEALEYRYVERQEIVHVVNLKLKTTRKGQSSGMTVAEVTHFFLYVEPLVPEVCTTLITAVTRPHTLDLG
jgi:hypothetical protein